MNQKELSRRSKTGIPLGGTVSGTPNLTEITVMQDVCYGFCDTIAIVIGQMFSTFHLTFAGGKPP